MLTPIIVEFEGIDGSGKTTGLEYVAAALKERGLTVYTTREVGCKDIPFCLYLRRLVLESGLNLDGRTMELCFAAMRVENEIHYKILEEYDVILSDRGYLSHVSYAEALVGYGFTRDLYDFLNSYVGRKPHKVLFFDITPEQAMSRMEARGTPADSIEKRGIDFQRTVAANYLYNIDTAWFKSRTTIINASLPLESVEDQLVTQIQAIREMIESSK